MKRKEIDFDDLYTRASHLWRSQWLLLTSGDFEKNDFNTMTVGWGSLGYMWGKPFAQVVVRPTRHTFSFMEKYGTFTLTAFPEEQHEALMLLGTKSGRDGDKITEAGLTPTASHNIPAPGFDEAELIIECKTCYWDDFDPDKFMAPEIDKHYPEKDYHRIYFGEILTVLGDEKFDFSCDGI